MAIDFASPEVAVWRSVTAIHWLVSGWLETAPRYGYILRFPDGRQSVTGYRFEPWHYRYVGVQIAQEYVSSGAKTFEVYRYVGTRLIQMRARVWAKLSALPGASVVMCIVFLASMSDINRHSRCIFFAYT